MHFINFFFINSINYDVNERILMPSKSRLFSQLIAGSGQIKADRLSDDISTIEQVTSTEDLTAVGNTVGDQRVINNNLYIWNGSGWYRIALINASPTWDSGGQPAVTYVLDADSPQDATVITLAASDPDGLPISYNYITSGQMDSMATISQDSSVFTITPKTVAQVGEGVELTGSITFRASDGVNILPQVSSFTLEFITAIENSRYTSLLATAVDTSNNSSFTDSSTNALTLGPINGPTSSSFSPYRSGGYSTSIPNGDANNLVIADDASFDIYDGDFTVEAWLYPTSFNASQNHWVSKGGNTTREWSFTLNSTAITAYWTTGGTSSTDSTVTVSATNSIKEWMHICIKKSGSTLTIYKNGVSLGTGTFTSIYNGSGTVKVGRLMDFTGISHSFNGYISDLRIVKGTAITPPSGGPSARLEAVTNTSLLTCHLPYIADGSSNNHTITVNGSVSTKPFSPYDYLSYDSTTHGGSIYFATSGSTGTTAGSGQYVQSALSSELTLNTNDFTIDCWVYGISKARNYPRVLQIGPQNVTWGSSQLAILYKHNDDNDSITLAMNGIGGNGMLIASGPINDNQWYHVAVTRSGSTFTMYINGESVGTYTSTGSATGTGNKAILIGSSSSGDSDFNGYISDLRVFNGTVVYTGNFTPPTEPVSSSTAAVHVIGTDASIIDKSQTNNLKLFGNTTGSTAQAKFASSKSMYFDAVGDYISIPVDEVYGFGTYDWTIETWLYCTKTGGFNAIFDTRVGTGTQAGNFGIGMYNTGRVQLFSGGIFYYPTDTLSFNTWQHLAVVKNSGTTTMYFNGTAASSTYSDSRDYGSSQPVQIGKDDTTSNYFGGYMQDFRISKGLARYTANFTPPTAPLEG